MIVFSVFYYLSQPTVRPEPNLPNLHPEKVFVELVSETPSVVREEH
jgi:hypothetical protein